MTFEAKPSVTRMQHDWRDQEIQHPKTGPPGLTYFQAELTVAWIKVGPANTVKVPSGAPVDTLLWRNSRGRITGILYHYPHAIPPFEVAGAVNLWTAPNRQRRGIGTRLLLEAFKRFDIDPAAQTYTPEGARLMNRVLAQLADNPVLTDHG